MITFADRYPICIQFMEEGPENGYYLAWLPDFGLSACSATGDTPRAAIDRLSEVKSAVIQHYQEVGRTIPAPSFGSETNPIDILLVDISRDISANTGNPQEAGFARKAAYSARHILDQVWKRQYLNAASAAAEATTACMSALSICLKRQDRVDNGDK